MADIRNEIITLIPQLNRYARFLTRNSDQASDLVQDCLERALSRASLYQPETDLRAWLFTMMRNLFINQKRSEKRAREYGERIKMDGIAVERPRQIDRLMLSELSSAIDQLGSSERQAIRLLAVLNYSYEDAAKQTKLPIGTLKSRLSRGRSRLREMLEGTGGAAPRLAAKDGRAPVRVS
jgi:RNA polymerase sigma-70 factor (ECF subfamily)